MRGLWRISTVWQMISYLTNTLSVAYVFFLKTHSHYVCVHNLMLLIGFTSVFLMCNVYVTSILLLEIHLLLAITVQPVTLSVGILKCWNLFKNKITRVAVVIVCRNDNLSFHCIRFLVTCVGCNSVWHFQPLCMISLEYCMSVIYSRKVFRSFASLPLVDIAHTFFDWSL